MKGNDGYMGILAAFRLVCGVFFFFLAEIPGGHRSILYFSATSRTLLAFVVRECDSLK